MTPSFRDLEEETNEAIALFGNKDARGIVLLKPYAEYYDEYAERVTELLAEYPLGQSIVKAGGHSAKKRTVLQQLGEFFDRFFGLS